MNPEQIPENIDYDSMPDDDLILAGEFNVFKEILEESG